MLGAVSLGAALIWGGVVFLVLVTVGALAARLVPGERSILVTELPPLRLPVVSNVVVKTVAGSSGICARWYRSSCSARPRSSFSTGVACCRR